MATEEGWQFNNARWQVGKLVASTSFASCFVFLGSSTAPISVRSSYTHIVSGWIDTVCFELLLLPLGMMKLNDHVCSIDFCLLMAVWNCKQKNFHFLIWNHVHICITLDMLNSEDKELHITVCVVFLLFCFSQFLIDIVSQIKK